MVSKNRRNDPLSARLEMEFKLRCRYNPHFENLSIQILQLGLC